MSYPRPMAAIMTNFIQRITHMPRELKLFVAASLLLGMAFSTVDSTFNNFLNESFKLGGFERSFLEFPREFPGFMVVFISAALWFLSSQRLGVVALLLAAAGSLLVGFASASYGMVVLWLFVFSMGQHIYIPIASTIGMELAREGKTGQRLGQLNALRNFATIAGSGLVFLGFNYLGFTFSHTFILAAIALVLAAALFFLMKPEQNRSPKVFLKLHREYRLYYTLSVLFGMRKQLFITFAPWVLVTIFNQPTSTIATLMTIGGVIGILFQPFLGRMIDRLGERFVLATEAFVLIFVCAGYGLARSIFPEGIAFLVVCACYLLDQMLLSVNMARSTYMKKIAKKPEDIQPTLTAGVTIDHLFSIAIAVVSGAIWSAFGYQLVFLLGAVIALVNFFVARKIKLPNALV